MPDRPALKMMRGVLPDALGPEVRARVEVGAEEMKRTLEGRLARR